MSQLATMIREDGAVAVDLDEILYSRGIQPEHNFRSMGSIFGRMRESTLCSVHKGIQDFLFEKLRENDPTTVEILRRWTTVRERTHFIQASAVS